MANPFKVPYCLSYLNKNYPDTETFLKFLKFSNISTRKILVTQWLTEGIPEIFKECAACFEMIRRWLAENINDIHSKDITLVGSSRFGYSLAPKKYSILFNENSDLDFAIVSKSLFTTIQDEYNNFRILYEEGYYKDKSTNVRERYKENIRLYQTNSAKGFLDIKKIPADKTNYPVSQNIQNLMYILCENLKYINNAPQPKAASVRVYYSWNSLINQVSLNLNLLRQNYLE